MNSCYCSSLSYDCNICSIHSFVSFITDTPSEYLSSDIKMHRLIGSFIVKEGFVHYSILWQVIIYSFKKLDFSDFKPVMINQLINFAGS